MFPLAVCGGTRAAHDICRCHQAGRDVRGLEDRLRFPSVLGEQECADKTDAVVAWEFEEDVY